MLASLLAALACLYAGAALRHSGQVNTDMEATDQSAYMNYAKKMVGTGYAHVGDRNRMPVYPFLLSLLYRAGMSDVEFFERGKAFNILLSLALLAGLFLVFRRFLPLLASLNLLLIAGFSVFLFRAAYVQAELLYYSLAFLGFLLACMSLVDPGWKLGLATGAVLAAAHLTKASATPAFALFAAVGLGAAAVRGPFQARRLTPILLAAAAFVAVLYPYISTSKRVFGRYFYNVNTTFYMWYDSREEIFRGTRARGDREGWPDLPPEEIPGLSKHLREHTAAQMAERVVAGLRTIWESARRGYGYLKYVLIYSVFACVAILWSPRASLALARERASALVFVLAYLAGYAILYAWISRVHAGVPRLILALFLPLMFCLAAVASSDRLAPPWARRAFDAIVLAVASVDTWFILTGRILTMSGGS